MLTPLGEVLALSRSARGQQADDTTCSFATRIPQDWTQGRTTFGGLLAAIAIRALELALPLPERRPLRSFVMDCIAPAGAGELEVIIEVLRAGKSLTHARASVVQNGKVCAMLLAVFGQALTSKIRVAGDGPILNAAPVETLPQMPYVEGVMPAFTQHFDYRWAGEHYPYMGSTRPEIVGYVRAIDAERVDAGVIAALADSFPSPTHMLMSAPAPASTVTWSMNFTHAGAVLNAADFCRYESYTRAADGGYSTCDTKVWDSSGRLLAESRQLVVEFSS